MSAAILAAVDMSSGSDAVVERAARLAKHAQVPLHVLHVAYALPAPYFAEIEPRIRQAIEQGFARYQDMARAVDVSITCDVREGGTFQEIIRFARRIGAGLIAVAPHGRNLLKDLMLGSTPSRLLRKGEAPVLVVRTTGGPYKNIVWMTDTSALADHAATVARSLVAPEAAVTAVAAMERPEALALLPELGPLPRDVVALESRTRSELENAVKRSAATVGWPGADVVVEAAVAAELGLDVAAQRQADLIVMGTLGLSTAANVLLGSTAEAVAARALCDVLAATPTERHCHV